MCRGRKIVQFVDGKMPLRVPLTESQRAPVTEGGEQSSPPSAPSNTKTIHFRPHGNTVKSRARRTEHP